MTRAWKPGDVVTGLLDGNEIVGIVRGGGRRMFYADSVTTDQVDIKHVRNLRPLVVVDPEDGEQVEHLAETIISKLRKVSEVWDQGFHNELRTHMQAALREFADPKPPKPEEPGTWGVVEASCVHSDERRKWVHHEDDNWWPAEEYGHAVTMSEKGRDPRLPDDWSDLRDVMMVREGVTP